MKPKCHYDSMDDICERFNYINNKYLKPLLLRQRTITRGASLLSIYQSLSKRDAMQYIEGSPSVLPHVHSDVSLHATPKTINYINGSQLSMQGQLSEVKNSVVKFSVAETSGTVIDMTQKTGDDLDKHHSVVLKAFHPARKRWVFKHKKHVIGEVHHQPVLTHNSRHRLRHLLHRHHRDHAERRTNKRTQTTATAEIKDKDLEDPLTCDAANERTCMPPLMQESAIATKSKTLSSDSDDGGITFSATHNAPPDTHDALSVDVNDPPDDPEAQSPTANHISPVAVETSLPWKRNTGRPPMSSSDLHSLPNDSLPVSCEAPAWVTKDYVVTPPSPDLSKHRHSPVEAETHSRHHRDHPKDIAAKNAKSYSVPNFMQSNGNANKDRLDASHHHHPRNHHHVKINAQISVNGASSNGDLPLPWRCNGDECGSVEEPMTSPSASHDVDLRPQSSNHSFRISDHDHCAQSHHSEPINVIPLVDRRQASFCEHETLLVCDDVDTIEMDPHAKIHDWLSRHDSDPHLNGLSHDDIFHDVHHDHDDLHLSHDDDDLLHHHSDDAHSHGVTEETRLVPSDVEDDHHRLGHRCRFTLAGDTDADDESSECDEDEKLKHRPKSHHQKNNKTNSTDNIDHNDNKKVEDEPHELTNIKVIDNKVIHSNKVDSNVDKLKNNTMVKHI